jgi:heat shock protein HslJ
MKKIILSLIVLSIVSFSCKSKIMTAKMAKIETGKFAVVKIDGISEVKNNPTMEIDFINNKISGSSACNHYGGDFTSKENNIKFNAMMGTKRYCPEFSKIERQFYKNIALVTHYEIKDNQILLYDKADTVMIVGELKK